MYRFFFNVHDGQSFVDVEGTELPSIAAARAHAARYAGELLRGSPDTFWNGDEWRMEVTDPDGLVLFCLLFVGVTAAAGERHP